MDTGVGRQEMKEKERYQISQLATCFALEEELKILQIKNR